jgi:alpha-beta hydrolase superfamily lysophospholipase/SAM-dependent methyltransferase
MTDAHRAGASPASLHQPTEHSAHLPGGAAVSYRAWLSTRKAGKAFLVFDCGVERADQFAQLARSQGFDDVSVLAWDWLVCDAARSGLHPARSCTMAVREIDVVARHLVETHSIPWEGVVVVASGAAAVAVAAWVHDFARPVRAMVLLAPAFGLKSFPPGSPSGFGSLLLSRGCRKAFLYLSERLIADAAAIRAPALVLTAKHDSTAGLVLQRRFFERLGSSVKSIKVFPGTGRDLVQTGWQEALDEVRRFSLEVFGAEAARAPLLDADRRGYTRDEYERVTRPLTPLSPGWAYYTATRALFRTLALVSPGFRLGWRTGFDSGEMLDYVYENRARGDPLLGRWIDRLFLNHPNWESCRRRKQLTEKFLRAAVERVRQSGRTVRIVDIAAGPGRYVLEAIRTLPAGEVSALLRDNTEANLEAGRRLAEQMGLKNVVFELGDAFDEASLAAMRPPPNVAVSCGIYQLFSENQMVLRSLRGLAAALSEDGWLVYTCLPWDPKVEMIARTLINRNRAPSAIRRRTQEELDELVRAAGFEKIDMEIDEFGISSVSLARKR